MAKLELMRSQRVDDRIRQGNVYAISVVGDPSALIKFGYATTVASRLKDLQIGSPVILEVLASCRARPHHERMLHKHLMRSRSHGEWFQRTSDALHALEMMKAGTLIEFLAPLTKHQALAKCNSLE